MTAPHKRGMRKAAVVALLPLMMLASCSSDTKKEASPETATTTTAASSSGTSGGSGATTTSPASDTPTTTRPSSQATLTPSGGWPGANGCNSPSAADVGTAFGTAITKSVPASNNGCLWETATPGRGVQVSYLVGDKLLSPVSLNAFVNGPGVTQLTEPGSSMAFIRTITIAGRENPMAYIVYPEGQVVVAFNGAPGTMPTSNLEATVSLILGA